MYIRSNGSRRFVTLPKYEYKFVGVSVTSCGECDATFKIINILGQEVTGRPGGGREARR